LDDSDLLVINRAVEAVFRPERGIDAELIVRIAELEVERVKPSSLQLLQSLKNYWEEYIRLCDKKWGKVVINN
jgi:hypothetical protein